MGILTNGRTNSVRLMILICAVAWIIAAIRPHNIQAWALEQIATIIAITAIWFITTQISITLWSYVGLTVLFVAHAIGTHYTYSLTPYDEFLQSLFGISIDDSFGWERNHYDRFVHLAFGVTVALPLFHLSRIRLHCTDFAAWFLSINLVLSLSALYELLEWTASIIFSSESGNLYLGSQGDIWDAQADMALAGLGAIVTCVLWYVIRYATPLGIRLQVNSD